MPEGVHLCLSITRSFLNLSRLTAWTSSRVSALSDLPPRLGRCGLGRCLCLPRRGQSSRAACLMRGFSATALAI